MIHRKITYFGQPRVVACDALCGKAWGIHSRPRIEFDQDDDYAFLADGELGIAPTDPGEYEGGDAKPTNAAQRLNRWCVRECERSEMAASLDEIVLHDFTIRLYNQPWKHEQ